jgi:hypothetical protein
MLFAGVVAVGVWLIADDAEMKMGDTATPAVLGAAAGLVVAVMRIVLAVSRFRRASSSDSTILRVTELSYGSIWTTELLASRSPGHWAHREPAPHGEPVV